MAEGQTPNLSPAVKQFQVPAYGGALLVLANLLDGSSTTCLRRHLCLGVRPNGSGEPNPPVALACSLGDGGGAQLDALALDRGQGASGGRRSPTARPPAARTARSRTGRPAPGAQLHGQSVRLRERRVARLTKYRPSGQSSRAGGTHDMALTIPHRCLSRPVASSLGEAIPSALSMRRVVACALSPPRFWPAPPMRCNPRKGGSPRPAGSVPRGGRRPDRDSSTAPPPNKEKTKWPIHPPPTPPLSSGK